MHNRNIHLSYLFLFAYILTTLPLHAQHKTWIRPSLLQPTTQFGKQPSVLTATSIRGPQPASQARTSAVAPTPIGHAANAFSTVVSENNCIHADDSSGILYFIHRSDPSVSGGASQQLRYDISTNRGASWNSDIGPLNPVVTSGQYPQVVGYRPSGSTAPLAGSAVFLSETMNALNTGTASLVTAGSPTSQEIQVPVAGQTVGGGGMIEGRKGEYWVARFSHNGTHVTDTLKIYKGVYNAGSQSTAWSLHAAKVMPWSLSYDGTPYTLNATVAFSPDGNTGWIATLGDLATARDSVFAPILLKSTDGGATWGNPVEVNLNSFPWVADSLRALWLDSLGTAPASSGLATAAFEYDLTVDAAGNPHMFFVIGTASVPTTLPQYSIYSALSKYAVDLSSSNQGSSFSLRLVAPVLAFRGTFGTPNSITQDNYPQVSRSQDGQYVFYSWVDSDTAQYTGSQTGIGFGVSMNLAPDLRIAGLRLADGFATCIHLITDGDLVWQGRAVHMQLAPEVFVSGSGSNTLYNLPMAGIELLNNDALLNCQYHYFGNDAVLLESDFAYPPGSSVYWLGCGINPLAIANIQGKVFADNNNNGMFDGGDAGIPNHVVTTSGITYADVSNVNGDFDVLVTSGFTYGLNAAALNPIAWTPTAPVSPYSLNVPTPGTVLTGNDFGFHPVANVEDLSVVLLTPPNRVFTSTPATIYVENHGTVPSSGTLVLTYDALTTILNAVPAAASINLVTRQATWNLPPLPLFGSYPIQLNIFTPLSTTIGTTLQFNAQVSLAGIDAVPGNNSASSTSLVIGSYDPNDKAVQPAGVGVNHQVDPGTSLKYRVRFQNTGNASAINVVVRDTLDSDLDISTFHMLGASHTHSLAIEQGRILVWSFLGINLPDSNTNEPASKGYIDFSISPKVNLPLGTVVENSASIYFDFNAPILTNTAWITYDVANAVASPLPSPAIRVFPNPVLGQATVEFQRYGGEAWTFALYDLQGRMVHQTALMQTAAYTFDREGLPTGIYLYKVTTADKLTKSGKLILN
jgi:uncharacterized repeat protein (TIGR01451 family)